MEVTLIKNHLDAIKEAGKGTDLLTQKQASEDKKEIPQKYHLS